MIHFAAHAIDFLKENSNSIHYEYFNIFVLVKQIEYWVLSSLRKIRVLLDESNDMSGVYPALSHSGQVGAVNFSSLFTPFLTFLSLPDINHISVPLCPIWVTVYKSHTDPIDF